MRCRTSRSESGDLHHGLLGQLRYDGRRTARNCLRNRLRNGGWPCCGASEELRHAWERFLSIPELGRHMSTSLPGWRLALRRALRGFSGWARSTASVGELGSSNPAFALVASSDNTTVTLRPSVDIQAGVAMASADQPKDYTLNKAQVLRVEQAADTLGSIIAADKRRCPWNAADLRAERPDGRTDDPFRRRGDGRPGCGGAAVHRAQPGRRASVLCRAVHDRRRRVQRHRRPGVRQHHSDCTDPTYPETNLVLVRKKATDGMFKDVLLECGPPLTGWEPIGTGDQYEYLRWDIASGSFMGQNGCDNGVHEATSDGPFGLTIWAWGPARPHEATVLRRSTPLRRDARRKFSVREHAWDSVGRCFVRFERCWASSCWERSCGPRLQFLSGARRWPSTWTRSVPQRKRKPSSTARARPWIP